jgi:tetratricopeptide (TPR) repeat protein
MANPTLSLVWKYYKSNQFPEAIDTGLALLKIEPDCHMAYHFIGLAKSKQGRHLEAEAAFRLAIDLAPENGNNFLLLGNALGAQDRYEEAAECYAKGMALDEFDVDFHRNYARLLLRLGRFTEAELELRHIFSNEPTDKNSGYDLARILKHRQEYSAAADVYKKILEQDGEWLDAKKHLWNCLLLSGRLKEGFVAYEERFAMKLVEERSFPFPNWDESNPLGLRLFIHAEQGFGDIIQMSRYIPLLAKRGVRVTLECPPFIASLLESVLGLERLIWVGDELPSDIDAEISIMSLPHRFGTELESIPADIPYIFPDAEKADEWKEKLGDGFKIGLVWQGNPAFPNDAKRSFPLAAMAELLAAPKVRFFGLQKEHGREQMTEFPQIIDLGPLLHDFSETAAVMANLDLLITCDTGLAHLAGAMGKQVWLALSYEPDWRWMAKRSDSPWYPTMRLFRQPADGDWGAVFAEMTNNLPQVNV